MSKPSSQSGSESQKISSLSHEKYASFTTLVKIVFCTLYVVASATHAVDAL